jgi:hypothetical protein
MKAARGALVAAALLMTGCDPLYRVRVAGPVPRAPIEECALDALNESPDVALAGVSDQGVIYAQLRVPDGLRAPARSSSAVGVRFEPSETWGGDLALEMVWLGQAGSDAYLAFVSRALRELHYELTIRCVPPRSE